MLKACQNANISGIPFRPGIAHGGHAARLEREGYIVRNPGLIGGFQIAAKGVDVLAKADTAKLLQKQMGKR